MNGRNIEKWIKDEGKDDIWCRLIDANIFRNILNHKTNQFPVK